MSDQLTEPEARPSTASGVRHGRQPAPGPLKTLLRLVGIGVAVIVVAATSVVAIETARQLSGIQTFTLPGGSAPNVAAMEGGFNVLLVGSDTGLDQGDLGKGRDASARNDVTMLLHVSADHTSAVAVSFPRDLVVPIPSCTNEKTGTTAPAMEAQPINVALGHGGMGCVAQTVTDLTGSNVDFAGLVTFRGVIEMSNAVGGVPVCLSDPIKDRFSGFSMPAGMATLSGEQALQFLRTRHGIGDGSDLTRISSQQVFLSSLVRTLKSNDTLNDFGKLYAIANAAISNMQLSTSLASPDTMVSIALALKGIDLDKVTFAQYPGRTGVGGVYKQKVKPNTALGDLLFAKINADEPFELAQVGDGRGSELNPNATPLPSATPTSAPASPSTVGPSPTETATPTKPPAAAETIAGVSGQTAADQTCTVGFGK